jgi:hypothetical protein
MTNVSDLPVEFGLLAACCRWPPSERRNAAIRSAASGAIDWNGFLQAVRRHRVAGLANDGLRRAGIPVPDAVAASLESGAKPAARQSLTLASEALRLQAALDAAGMPCAFLKGTTLAQLAYGNIGIKQAWDIDLLVLPNSIRKACIILRDAGYARVKPPARISDRRFFAWSEFIHECVFHSNAHGTFVELHWRLSENAAILRHVTAKSATQAVEIMPGRAVRTLNTEDLFAYLCMHGARHGWARIKWLADLAAWLATMAPEEIERLYRHAVMAGAGRAPDQALSLCARLLATQLPPALSAEIEKDRVTRRLVTTALRELELVTVGTIGEGALPEDLGRHFSHFLLWREPRRWLQELGSKLIGNADVLYLPLPRPFYFLYLLVRLPSWIYRHPPVLRKKR